MMSTTNIQAENFDDITNYDESPRFREANTETGASKGGFVGKLAALGVIGILTIISVVAVNATSSVSAPGPLPPANIPGGNTIPKMTKVEKLYRKIQSPEARLFFRSVIAPPDGSTGVYFWDGSVYLDIPGNIYDEATGTKHGGGRGGTPIFGFEGYNIRKAVVIPRDDTVEGGDIGLISREIVFFTATEDGTDPATGNPVKRGDVVTSWMNPITGKVVPVYPITNEYLVNRFRVGTYGSDGAFGKNYTDYIDDGQLRSVIVTGSDRTGECKIVEFEGGSITGPFPRWGGMVNIKSDIWPLYKLDDCGRWGINDTMNLKNGEYGTAELFSFWTPESTIDVLQKEINDEKLGKVPKKFNPDISIAWSRIGPASPWMGMQEGPAISGDDIPGFEGRVVYTVSGGLLEKFDDMPKSFIDKLEWYFDKNGAAGQNLTHIGFRDGDGDGWEFAPKDFDPNMERETSYSVFYYKNLAPEGLTWKEWVKKYIDDAQVV